MNPKITGSPNIKSSSLRLPGLFGFIGILCVILSILFWRSFDPAWVLFANDGPFGAIVAERSHVPEAFTGSWSDLNGYGLREPGALPNITSLCLLLLGPLGFAKFYAPLTLVILGIGSWFLCRQLGLGALAAILAGLATTLCSTFFGVSCWGVGPQAICFGLNYLALGIVVSPYPLKWWLRYPLAGLTVGMGVMEAFDIGAIFSVLTAVCVMAHAVLAGGNYFKTIIAGIGRVMVIGIFAGLIASAGLSGLIGTQVKGVAGMEEDARSKDERWDWATQWSTPKIEVFGAVIPGLFGFRMDTPDGGVYWGKAGRSPAWDRYFASGKHGTPPDPRFHMMRYGGGGNYTGVLLSLVVIWALAQSFRKENPVFSPIQNKLLWFFSGVMLVSLFLSFGRFAPFGLATIYKHLYGAIPLLSAVRNPSKFIHVFQWSLLVVFAHGVYGLSRRYLETPALANRDLVSQVQSWWANASSFDRKWTRGMMLALGVSVLAWFIYGSYRSQLLNYLQEVNFEAAMAEAIATFSARQVGIFVMLLAISTALFTVILSGYFNGRRARIGAVLLGLLLVVDLAVVDTRWVVNYNWKEKYVEASNNPVIDFLRQKPYEQRVAISPKWLGEAVRASQQLMGADQMLQQVYGLEWTQHLFQFNNIQTLDIIQMPRVPTDIAAYETALQFDGNPQNLHRVSRKWQLTNTRYLLGTAGLVNAIKLLDPDRQRIKPVMAFEFYQEKSGGPILTRTNASGPFALFEFTGALQRAQLYSQWQVSTNDQDTLKKLADKDFDPAQSVFVAENVPMSDAANSTNTSAGSVEFVSYAPKHIVLKAQAAAPAVLLLNDKHDPNWQVIVDGQAATLLRCNFLMRGVQLSKGEHKIEFHFRPSVNSLYVSLVGISIAGLLICIIVLLHRRRAT